MSKTSKFFYKYLPFERHKEGNNEVNYSLEIFRNNRFHFAKHSDLNDPFELLDDDDKIIEDFRIISLTNSHIKKLMWSYYANGHKGICIKIKIPEKYIYPVIYCSKSKRSKMTLEKIPTKGKSRRKVAYKLPGGNYKFAICKDSKWKSELEYRIILDINNIDVFGKSVEKVNGHYFFSDFKIERVVFGNKFNFDTDDAKELMKILKNNEIKTKKVELSKKDYSLLLTDVKEKE